MVSAECPDAGVAVIPLLVVEIARPVAGQSCSVELLRERSGILQYPG
jgi:hypothetical protein